MRCPDHDTGFFFQFATQPMKPGFTRFQLTTWEFPTMRQVLSLFSFGEKYPVVIARLRYDRRDDVNIGFRTGIRH